MKQSTEPALRRAGSPRAAGAAALTALALAFAQPPQPVAAAGDELARGKYLATIMDCTGCHTPGTLAGQPDMARYLGGSDIGFEIPGVGYFYPPNLTSDKDTGLGNWTVGEIVAAVRTGVRPDGRQLIPVMPWMSYQALTDEDARALATYLKTLPPVSNKVPGPYGASEKTDAPYLTVRLPD